mmetsp:Transcript_112133/g.328061  ORF Transcript_112133/g.328061 Transcript_112133/m.328061 type:complete len:225 (-) Transcript_112133:16-690(-)
MPCIQSRRGPARRRPPPRSSARCPGAELCRESVAEPLRARRWVEGHRPDPRWRRGGPRSGAPPSAATRRAAPRAARRRASGAARAPGAGRCAPRGPGAAPPAPRGSCTRRRRARRRSWRPSARCRRSPVRRSSLRGQAPSQPNSSAPPAAWAAAPAPGCRPAPSAGASGAAGSCRACPRQGHRAAGHWHCGKAYAACGRSGWERRASPLQSGDDQIRRNSGDKG